MSDTKFTPGPWTVINGNKLFPCVVMAKVDIPEDDIGTLNYPYPNVVINRSHNQNMGSIIANARLIAAAPEMYELLVEFKDFCNHTGLFDTSGRIESLLTRINKPS